ncbi:MAG TPA: Ig-like domain-containing protein [Gemmatimonadaceae bacterium]|nr:Ig-like domain-containing protein [Gemmatimonadaceae bacterium]
MVRAAAVTLVAGLFATAPLHNSTVSIPVAMQAAGGCAGYPGKWGDATNDGLVNIVDAQQIARYSVALSVANPVAVSARGDVTADAIVNIVDAQQIARYSVGLGAAARVATDMAAPTASTVSLSPSGSQTVSAGGTLQLTATPRDAANNDISACSGINWTTNNQAVATVSATGLVSALVAGNATITARSVTNSAALATVSITVPSAATVLFTETFENTSFTSRGWYDAATPLLSTTDKFAGNSAGQWRFLQGAQIPSAGMAMRHKFTPTSSVYLSMYIKYSANWVGSGRSYQPHEFHFLSSLDADYAGPGHNWMTAYVEHSYQNGGRPLMAIQDNKSINTTFGSNLPLDLRLLTEDRSVAGCNGPVETGLTSTCFALPGATPPWYNFKQILGPVAFQPNPGTGYKNDWNFIEAYFQMNTVVGGVALPNGVMQYWFNGQLIIDKRDVLFRTGARASLQFGQFLIAPYIGDGSPADQSMYIDNLTVATGR